MIISHSKKFCYWKIARTGSNTAELCIRMSKLLDLSQDVVTSCHFFPASHNVPGNVNVKMLRSGHVLPSQAIELGMLTPEQYDSYDHYTIVRHPIDRWISAYAFRCRMMRVKSQFSPTIYWQKIINCKPCYEENSVTRLQSDYLQLGGVQTFPFSDYEKSIRAIIAAIGGTLEDVPKLEHKTLPHFKSLAERELPDFKSELLDYYAADLALNY